MKKQKVIQKILYTVILGVFCSVTSFAQSAYDIIGAVTSEDGQPLPGVNVLIKAANNGTVTDFDGNYTINASKGDKIEFNYLGFSTQVIAVTGQKTINVTLKQDTESLADVVVIGYGSRKKSDVTGSVSSVKAEELTAFPVLNAAQALQGRAAGVEVQSNNGGEPGAPINIVVRGTNSIGASSDPLIVVDGFIGATFPQANDIQSIEVLKDASSTAIYGSRGAGGVILVTTKKGKSGKVSVEVNSSYSIQNIAERFDLLDAEEYIDFRTDQNPTFVAGGGSTDWQDVIFDSGFTQDHQLSFSGGSDKVNLYSSINYFKQEGAVANSEFNRLTFLTNVNAQLNDKLKLGLNVFGSRGVQDGIETQSSGDNANGGNDDLISLAFRSRPDFDVFDADGNFNTILGATDLLTNIAAIADLVEIETITDNYRANFTADYNILKNLKFNTSFGFSVSNERDTFFKPTFFGTGDFQEIPKSELSTTRRTTYLTESYLNYTADITENINFSALAGYSYQENARQSFEIESTFQQGLDAEVFDRLGVDGLEFNTPEGSTAESRSTVQEIQSVFGRVNLDILDKYLITATVRRDGSSNFALNEKYATFPSAAIGWKVSNEDFLKDSNVVSNLKVRASYGETGNQAIGPFDSLGAFEASNGSLIRDRFANSDLKWETSFQTNVGVDLGLLNDRINLTVDYYNIDTEDLLLEVSGFGAFAGTGDAIQFQNVGEVNNRGLEVSLNTLNISNGDFRWSTDFNWATNKNEIKALRNDTDIIGDASPGFLRGRLEGRTDTTILRVGEALGTFFGSQFLGVDEITGESIFEEDQIIGDPNPDWTFGITNNFSYKNIDLSIFVQGVQGGDILNLNALAMTVEGSNTESVELANTTSRVSSQFVEDGSYVRLKNVAIGYTLPKDAVRGLGVESIRLGVSGQNLLTFTDYSGLDPEVSFNDSGDDFAGSNSVRGIDFGNYPTIRSVTFSLNLKF